MTELTAFLILLSLTVPLLLGIHIGKISGRATERERCMWLCRQLFYEGKLSASVRRIHMSIHDGNDELISEDAFFG